MTFSSSSSFRLTQMLCFCNLDPQLSEVTLAPWLLSKLSVSSHRKLSKEYSYHDMEKKELLSLKSAYDIAERG